MIIREGNDSIEIAATERVPSHLPCAGDTRLAISVQAGGFSGQGWAWVDAARLEAFIARLRELEARRQGDAEVASLSPGQFWLRIAATDRAGHMVLAGRLSHGQQALSFGFEFCPSVLPAVIQGFTAMLESRA
jgi:hypothetical protein